MYRLLTSSILAAALSLSLLGGCASNRTFVLQPPTQVMAFKTVSIKPGVSSIEVEADDRADFEASLAEKLTEVFGAAPVASGDLTLEYRFVLNDKGNTAFRVGSNVLNLVGSPFYGFGDGAIGVEVIYTSRNGTKLAHIVTDGTLSGAFGNTGSAINEATSSIAKYAQANFAPAPPADSSKPGTSSSAGVSPAD